MNESSLGGLIGYWHIFIRTTQSSVEALPPSENQMPRKHVHQLVSIRDFFPSSLFPATTSSALRLFPMSATPPDIGNTFGFFLTTIPFIKLLTSFLTVRGGALNIVELVDGVGIGGDFEVDAAVLGSVEATIAAFLAARALTACH
jgi:hypothetical protein